MNNLENHYDKWSIESKKSWVLSGGYTSFWALEITKLLDISSKHRICDLGAGTCRLSAEIIKLNHSVHIDCVEPFVTPEVAHDRLSIIKEDALKYFENNPNISYNSLFFKQSLHHIPSEKWPALFLRVKESLHKNGKVLVLTMPETIEYPMFSKAKERFHNNQLKHISIINCLADVGMSCSSIPIDYKVTLNKNYYFDVIRRKFISDLAAFSREEIEEGIEEIEKNYRLPDEFELVDRLWAFLGHFD